MQCLKAQKIDEALHHVDLFLSIRPDSIKALTLKAEILEEMGRLDDALQLYIHVLESGNNNQDVLQKSIFTPNYLFLHFKLRGFLVMRMSSNLPK